MALSILTGGRSEQGNHRPNNEDRFFIDADAGLFLVADGMGGQLAGEKASSMAIEIIRQALADVPAAHRADPARLDRHLRDALRRANDEILALGEIDHRYRGMGTTIVLGALAGMGGRKETPTLCVIGMGDSRAYHLRRSKFQQITTDHSIVAALIRAGTISPVEAAGHSFRGMLYKYLGAKEGSQVPETTAIRLQAGDRFLFATDGLTGPLGEDELRRLLQQHDDPQQAADCLIEAALARDTHDNATCIVLAVRQQ